MNEIFLKVPAKINLLLKILDKCPDGYHNIQSLMQTISIYDEIKITKIDREEIEIVSTIKKLNLTCKLNEHKPEYINNTLFKAARLMFDAYNPDKGIKIEVTKKIPIGSGMGGGSADAAGVISGIQKLFNIDINKDERTTLGLKIGSDVPFCLSGNSCFIYGKGEKIKPVNLNLPFHFVLLKPKFSISTRWAYQEFDNVREYLPKADIDFENSIINALMEKNYKDLDKLFVNDFEDIVFPSYPFIKDLKEKLREFDATASFMSGSGSTVVGVFESEKKAYSALNWFISEKTNLKLEMADIATPVRGIS